MIKVTLIGTGRLSFNLMNEILNNKRLKLMIEDIVKAGMIQKDDLTIVTVDSIQ